MILRDKGKITKMLILLELLRGKRRLKDIASAIDITVQGVSEYMRMMEKEGYVKNGEVTVKGLEFLSSAIEEMGDFLAEATRTINLNQVVEAIAGEDIEEGARVGLVMENGYIHAYLREESSTGYAMNSARKGEPLGVTNLSGVLRIDYGNVEVIAFPRVEDLDRVNEERVREIILERKGWKVGTCGVVAHVFVSRVARADFNFSAVNAAIDAHYRGISTLLFVSHPLLPHVLKTLEERGVRYTLRSL